MRVPAISGEKLVSCLTKKFGFQIVRQKGSHVSLRHPDGRAVTVPCHKGEDLSRGLLIKIIKKEVKISVEDFMKFFTILFTFFNN